MTMGDLTFVAKCTLGSAVNTYAPNVRKLQNLLDIKKVGADHTYTSAKIAT